MKLFLDYSADCRLDLPFDFEMVLLTSMMDQLRLMAADQVVVDSVTSALIILLLDVGA